jgi:hypothetical protein
MGVLGNLFGKKEPQSRDRCMECGMTEGRHTDWCPAHRLDEEPGPEPPEAVASASGAEDSEEPETRD